MLFNSFIFWVFFLVVILLYVRMAHTAQNRMLLVASYIFYGYWDYRFLSLILISTIIDYYVALNIDNSNNETSRKRFLSISIAANLGMLGFFKYFGFFSRELVALLDVFGIQGSPLILDIVLPVGISFYTFQTMSYTIDVYQGKTKSTSRFLDFALYVSFFPQLVAGPIERSSHLLPQILKNRKYQDGDFTEGLYHVIFGLFKKVVIADNMAPIVNAIFSKPLTDLTGPEVIVGVYAFAFQIYGDFSGYSSIAKGIGRWMGFDIMWNFKNPYFAISPSDFWQRWHISLSSWLRDYLYFPLGGSRMGKLLTLRNLMITMLLGGLWHGAAWTFVIWGAYHGFILIVYRIYEGFRGALKKTELKSKFHHAALMVLMFHLVCVSWLLFRAESMNQVFTMLTLVFTDFQITDLTKYTLAMMFFFVAPLMCYEYFTEKKNDLLLLLNIDMRLRVAAYTYMAIMLWVFPPLQTQDFIYFQF